MRNENSTMISIKGSTRHRTYSYRLRPIAPHVAGNYEWTVAGALDFEGHPEAADLLEVGKAIHLADRAVRRSHGAAHLCRRIEVTIPVQCVAAWKKQVDLVETIAEFATGDTWHVRFQQSGRRPSRICKSPTVKGTLVALFSGGLDSLCGAAYLARNRIQPVFVSHSPPGRVASRELVQDVYAAFGRETPGLEQFVSFRLEVRECGLAGGTSMLQEMSRRSRPVYFLSLATAVAMATGIQNVQMSENGALALSLPNRFDAHGPAIARQAHSFILEAFAELAAGLTGISTGWRFVNPFVSMTKGQACALLGPAAPLARRSVSCEYSGRKRAELLAWISSHPPIARGHRLGSGPHCGLCYPCLVRRAALRHAEIPDPASDYFGDAPYVLKRTWQRGSAAGFFTGRVTPPLLNTLAANPLYHQRFCDSLLAMSAEEFTMRYLPQLRSVQSCPEKDSIPVWSRALMRRFAREQLEFLHDSTA